LKGTSIAGLPSVVARVSTSRKFQTEFASGTLSRGDNPRERMNDRRSLAKYSVRSSDSDVVIFPDVHVCNCFRVSVGVSRDASGIRREGKTMRYSKFVAGLLIALGASFCIASQSRAMEIFSRPGQALTDNITEVYYRAGGGVHRGGSHNYGGAYHRGGTYHEGVYAGPVYREGVYNGPVYRKGVYNGPVYRKSIYNGPVFHEGVFSGGVYRDFGYHGGVYDGGIAVGFYHDYGDDGWYGSYGGVACPWAWVNNAVQSRRCY
jgi:hypothetical protein